MVSGIVLVVVGLVFSLGGGALPWIGRLPGDIAIERPHMRFYFPLTTCILISVIVSLAAIVVRWFR